LGVGRSSLLGFCLPALLIVAAYLLVRHALFAGEYKLTPAVFEQPWRPLLSYVYALQTHVAPFRELVYEPVESVWLSPWRLGVAGLAVVVLGGLAFRRSSWRVAVFWLLWYVVLQLPTANLLRQEALFDERYTFLALLGLLGLGLLAARNAWEWPRLRVEVTALLAVAVVAAGWVSAGRRAYFGDDRTFFQQWLRTNPRHARAYYFLGTRLASLGQTQDAAKMFAMALVLNPELPAARYNLANTLLALGQAEKALPHYESAVALRPDDVRYRSNWGVALLQCGRPGQARQVLQTAVALEPRFANAHHNLGMAYAALNDLTNAVAEFRLAADLSPDQADPHFNLGRLLLDLGRTNEAAAAFRNVLRIDPDDKEARKTLERIR
jgi:tetratricopeptide (TPR) repeat protein